MYIPQKRALSHKDSIFIVVCAAACFRSDPLPLSDRRFVFGLVTDLILL